MKSLLSLMRLGDLPAIRYGKVSKKAYIPIRWINKDILLIYHGQDEIEVKCSLDDFLSTYSEYK